MGNYKYCIICFLALIRIFFINNGTLKKFQNKYFKKCIAIMYIKTNNEIIFKCLYILRAYLFKYIKEIKNFN